jgi:predicted component of type VI protein secretion system
MPAQLVALGDGPSILLDKPILLLGRHPECDIQIDSRKISRRHCCIAQVSDYLVIRDLASTNGVRINGVRVVEGRLAAGDELTIGSHRYRVSWESAAEQPPRRAAAPPGAPKPHQRPTVLDAVPDDLLENCDEPVPLPEPGAAHASLPYPLPAPAPAKPPPPPGEASKILPEHIDLVPSDPFPNVSNPSSHHGP